ncbi:hypothetical protein GCM10010289_45270 [Streptomyces violascens]|uniref:Uncharacterized protein n=1 Tax=Streptomyces violascens TaxID=67381 RepID=A0ABQ3QXW1_9ACTN|nr:hypothetical protein GCM10010289_45270 [Streptomyces violascens]GHI42119.1 hypothetical protein Sviol_65270 [Streptomyces violascens]
MWCVEQLEQVVRGSANSAAGCVARVPPIGLRVGPNGVGWPDDDGWRRTVTGWDRTVPGGAGRLPVVPDGAGSARITLPVRPAVGAARANSR